MQNIIIGTAGHIDHGKTTLIKALTGRDTDNLPEEKKRGISINLGFTYFDLSSGKRAGIIDVPGHERFIKNMLAGACGIDIVLLTIAANEGIKPQTLEHIDILSFLNIKKGLIVLTKSGLADSEFKFLVKEDICENVKGTFLENAEIIEVDSIEKTGIEYLKKRIDNLSEEITERDDSAPTRLNIDRVFSIKGFGTVVTGTLAEGVINLEDELTIYPKGIKVRIRNIQVHDKNAEKAFSGQRVAINLSNVKVSDIERGDVLAASSSLFNTTLLDVKLKMLERPGRELKNNDRLRLYTGTKEIMTRVVLHGKNTLKPGETCFAQFKLEEICAVKNKDKFVVRYFSPMETIGGGVVLDTNPKKHRRNDRDIMNSLIIKEQGDLTEITEEYIKKEEFVSENTLCTHLNSSGEKIKNIINELIVCKKVMQVNTFYMHKNYYEIQKNKIISILESYHLKYPLRKGMPKEELRTRIRSILKIKEFDTLLSIIQAENLIQSDKNFINNKSFSPIFTKKQLQIKKEMEDILIKSGYMPPDVISLTKNNSERIMVLEALTGDTIIKLDDSLVIHKNYYDNAISMALSHLNQKGEITLSEFRDMTKSSRKYALALLEYFDNNKITLRKENTRVLYRQ